MSGRGNLLSLFNKKTYTSEIPSSSDDREIDSGLDGDHTGSSGESLRFEKKIGCDILNSLEQVNISVGRGRAQLIQTLQNENASLKEVIPNKHNYGKDTRIGESKAPHLEREVLSNELFYPDAVHGSKGSTINLSCNYLEITTDKTKGVFQYEVRFFPNVDSLHLRMKYLNEHKEKLGGCKTFDGTTLYLPILLENQMTVYVSKTECEDVEIRILFKKKEDLKNCVHLYNILFDRVMKTLNYVRFNRKQFDPSRPKIIPLAKLEVWPGYVTAVDEYEGGLMLCCDVSHRILCQKTVLDMLVDIYQQNVDHFQECARKTLIGNIVLTRYNNRTYKINEICFDQTPMASFQTKSGETSYLDYYKKYHNITIKDVKQPLLLSIKKSRVNTNDNENIQFGLIPELCYLTGLRDDMRSDNKLMREIATFTRVSPNQRQMALDKFHDNVSKTPAAKEILNGWGLSLTKNYNSLKGRQLDPELIYFSKQTVPAGKNAEFSKYVVNNEMLQVVHINKWILIHLKNDLRAANNLLDNIKQCSKSLGINVSKPTMISLDHDRIDAYIQALRRNIDLNSQIVVCICHNSRDDRYSAIKKICCSELPIPSQVINAKTLLNETKNRSIVQKIILQMNCKIGGSLWTVKIPFKNVMICGIDSYHDPSNQGSSVAAFVASMNSTYSQWYSRAIVQTRGEEIVNGLSASFEDALKLYEKRNGYLPESVVIYRDGIGDGQLNICSKYEIPQFESVCRDRIKISFIVVQKRINTRLFSYAHKLAYLVGQSIQREIADTLSDKLFYL
ncbi:protein argonaute-3 isoform X2 [Drosophila kikkawai]|uniref:Protein argonaute-3 isoform X2 n=1 Tax=Drosophila kikkawai TaxID=30033 RepID=A0ABM4GIA3_DROKI